MPPFSSTTTQQMGEKRAINQLENTVNNLSLASTTFQKSGKNPQRIALNINSICVDWRDSAKQLMTNHGKIARFD